MSHSASRKARIFIFNVEALVSRQAPVGVQHSFVIYDVHPGDVDEVINIIWHKHQDEVGFYLTKEPMYDKNSYELTIYGMFDDEDVYDEDE